MPAATTANSIKALHQERADLTKRETTLRSEMLATYAKAREEKRALTAAEKKRDDEIKAELGTIDVDAAFVAEQF
jgi:predicted phage gp36 major capsid-like protein